MNWSELIGDLKRDEPFVRAMAHVERRLKDGAVIYPPRHQIFNAFRLTPLARLKVVILGQDPYHGPGQAHGLCFSVPFGIEQPPSLKNILKELADDLGCSPPNHGCLIHWAQQGVLLLNASLTVEAGRPQSHAHIGWTEFTDQVIQRISEHCDHLVFMLWGAFARRKKALIHAKHTILEAPHPSPLSAHRGFLGCRHFSKANQALMAHGQSPIDWQLPDTDHQPTHEEAAVADAHS